MLYDIVLEMHDRRYEKKMQTVEKFIRKHGTTDHLAILNGIDIDYDNITCAGTKCSYPKHKPVYHKRNDKQLRLLVSVLIYTDRTATILHTIPSGRMRSGCQILESRHILYMSEADINCG